MKRFLLMIAAGFTVLAPAWSNTITTYNTGFDASNNLLVNGGTDAHYALISPSAPARAIPFVDLQFYNWLPADGSSMWIDTTGHGNYVAAGDYIFRTTFDLTGLSPSSAVLSGRWSTDNEGKDIVVNGNSCLSSVFCTLDPSVNTATSYLAWHAFTISGGFVAGLNTLDFLVHNDSGATAITPMGLRVEYSGTAGAATPEPSAMVLMGIGLVAAGFRRRRRHAEQAVSADRHGGETRPARQ